MTEANERLVVKPALETVRAFDGPLDIDLGTLLASDGAALDVTAADGARGNSIKSVLINYMSAHDQAYRSFLRPTWCAAWFCSFCSQPLPRSTPSQR